MLFPFFSFELNVNYVVQIDMPIVNTSECLTMVDSIFVNLTAGSGYDDLVRIGLPPTFYIYNLYDYQSCDHTWVYEIGKNLIKVATGGTNHGNMHNQYVCPTFGADLNEFQVVATATAPFFGVCTVSQFDYNNGSAEILSFQASSSWAINTIADPVAADSVCWSHQLCGFFAPKVLRQLFIDQCTESVKNSLYQCMIVNHASLIDAISLSFSLMSLVYAILIFLARKLNHFVEKRQGMLDYRNIRKEGKQTTNDKETTDDSQQSQISLVQQTTKEQTNNFEGDEYYELKHTEE